ncbi:MAG: hypothetical protein ABL868_02390 [Sulfuriferula sp.]
MYLSMLNVQEKTGFYSLAHALAQSHEDISAEERSVLDASAHEMGIESPSNVLDVKSACAAFVSNASKRVAVLELALLALVDDNFANEEQGVMNEVISELGLTEGQVNRVMGLAEAILAQYRSGKRFIES